MDESDNDLTLYMQQQKKYNQLEQLVLGTDTDVLEQLGVEDEEIKSKKFKTKESEKRKPAWEDSDDKTEFKLSKFQRSSVSSDKCNISAENYIHKLKSKFESINSTPNWATKRVDDPQADDGSDVDDFSYVTGDSLIPSQHLPPSIIDFKRCTNANKENKHGAKLKCLEFHPTAQVLLTAGMDHRLSLFQVDGKHNPHIQSTYFTNYPIYTARFTADGNEVIVGSHHANFYYYDMIAGKIVNVPRIKAINEPSMRYFEVSPDGSYIAFRGKYGYVHLVSAKSKEWITSLKMNGRVNCICFSKDGTKLFSHGEDGQVYIWCMKARDCIHRFYDEGCIHGTSIAISKCSRFLACGSNTGVVNLYDMDTCMSTNSPRALKAIMNLTTPATNVCFNSSSEILALSSSLSELSVKLFHIPSLSMFSNFPDRIADKDIRMPICLDFSLNSGFFSVGTNKGNALLYRLKHYGNY